MSLEDRHEVPISSLGSKTGLEVARSMNEGAGFVGNFAQAARADACVGPAQTANGHTIVPVASVSVTAGFGLGFGGGTGGEGATQGQGSGGGGGGGGRGASRVIAVIDVSEGGVEVRPVIDMTMLSLGFLAFLGIVWVASRGRGAGQVAGPLSRLFGRAAA
jgi:uncharacterized spore protein YtfJ